MTEKRKSNRTSWTKGKSGNPKGRPKDGLSYSAIFKEVSNWTVEEVLNLIQPSNDLAIPFKAMPRNVQLKYLLAIRLFAASLMDPSHGISKEIFDRSEGKVPDRLIGEQRIDITHFEDAIHAIYGRTSSKS